MNVHITHINDTIANVRSNMDEWQYGCLTNNSDTNAGSSQDDAHCHTNASAAKIFVESMSKWINPSTGVETYLDIEAKDFYAQGDVYIGDDIVSLGDTDSYIDFATNDVATWVLGNVQFLYMSEDDAQKNIKWNSGTADVDFIIGAVPSEYAFQMFGSDGSIELQDDDVAHGCTTVLTTTAYARFAKGSATEGGLVIIGASDDDTNGVDIRAIAIGGNEGDCYCRIRSHKVSGTGVADVDANDWVLQVWNNDATVFNINGDGDMSLGAVVPAHRLVLPNAEYIAWKDNAGTGETSYVGSNADDGLTFYTNGQARVTIDDANGYVGVGIAAPVSKFHVSGGGGGTNGLNIQIGTFTAMGSEYSGAATILGMNAAANIATGEGMHILETNGTYGAQAIRMHYIDGMTFHTLSGSVTADAAFTSERMRITNAGVIGIGTASPDRKLHVEVEDSAVDTVAYVARLSHMTTGTAAGYNGVGLEFEAESQYGTEVYGAITAGGGSASYLGKMRLQVESGDDTLIDMLEINTTGAILGAGAAGVDYALTFNGENNDGVVTWMEDESQFRFSNVLRTATSLYRRYYHLAMTENNPGASGATWTNPGAGTIGGWQVDASTETLNMITDVHADWDGASDMEVEIYFEKNTAGGTAGDTVDLKLVAYYKGEGESVTKTQTPAESVTVVADNAQYTQYKATFVLDWDKASNVIQVGDNLHLVLNLETDTSECDNIIINHGSFSYLTTHCGIESGDA